LIDYHRQVADLYKMICNCSGFIIFHYCFSGLSRWRTAPDEVLRINRD